MRRLLELLFVIQLEIVIIPFTFQNAENDDVQNNNFASSFNGSEKRSFTFRE
jgi:hypothetical protein